MPYRLLILLCFGLFALVSYLLGSINFAILITRAFTGRDVRAAGSGNAGMTNVMRTAGFLPGLLTFLGDFLKAVAAVALGKYLLTGLLLSLLPAVGHTASGEVFQYAVSVAPIYGATICGFFCLLGHMFPVFFGFRGGKGIVTAVGTILVLDWRLLCVLAAIFGLVFLCTRIISLASIVAALCYPPLTYLCFSLLPGSDPINRAALSAYQPLFLPLRWFLTLAAAAFALLVLLKHGDNIRRLLRGEEKRLTLGRSKPPKE